jgi:tryptophan synthase alpha chain
MNRIDSAFARARADGRKLLMPFLCGGYPRAGSVAATLPALERAGASIVEIGIPFSDPIADGPLIAEAMHEALTMGATPRAIFDEVASVRGRLSVGLVAMCSVSIVHRMGGPARFAQTAAAAGFDGLIVPDVPVEESGEIVAASKAVGLTCSLLVSPNTPPARAARIVGASTGFVYLLARSGITGERSDAPDVSGPVAAIRQSSTLPIACGFGISSASHVRAVVQDGGADAAIVGSALVRRMGEAAKAGRDPIGEAEVFTRDLASGLRAASA